MSWEIEIIGDHNSNEKVDAVIQNAEQFTAGKPILYVKNVTEDIPSYINNYFKSYQNIDHVMAVEIVFENNESSDTVFYITRGKNGNTVLEYGGDPDVVNGAVLIIDKKENPEIKKGKPITGQVENPLFLPRTQTRTQRKI